MRGVVVMVVPRGGVWRRCVLVMRVSVDGGGGPVGMQVGVVPVFLGRVEM